MCAASAAFVGMLIAGACGARSELALGAGSGGQVASSSSAASGTGTGGGASSACGNVVQVMPVLTLDAQDGDGVQPSVMVLPTSPPSAAVAYVWQGAWMYAYPFGRVASFPG